MFYYRSCIRQYGQNHEYPLCSPHNKYMFFSQLMCTVHQVRLYCGETSNSLAPNSKGNMIQLPENRFTVAQTDKTHTYPACTILNMECVCLLVQAEIINPSGILQFDNADNLLGVFRQVLTFRPGAGDVFITAGRICYSRICRRPHKNYTRQRQ